MSIHELCTLARCQYYLLLLLLIAACVPYIRPVRSQIAGPLLLYSTKGDIRLTNTTKTTAKNRPIVSLIKDVKDGSAFDYHYKQSKICWFDTQIEAIKCASFNETAILGQIEVVAYHVDSLDGMACDWLTDKLYWTDIELNKIEVVSMVDHHRKVLFWKDLDQPRAIALDPSKGLLFWTDWGDVAKIEKASMDGDPSTREVIVSNDIFWPNGLTLDYEKQQLYWIDGRLRYLKRVGYNGMKVELVIKQISEYPYALTFFNGRLFWTDWKTWDIYVYDPGHSSSSSSNNNRTFRPFISSGTVPMDIHVLDARRQPQRAHACETLPNGGCSHLCLLAATAPFFSCACPSGIRLLADGRRCAGAPQELLVFVRRTQLGLVYLDSPDYPHHALNVSGLRHAVAVDYDPVFGDVYWTDTSLARLRRARLDGGGGGEPPEDVLTASSDGVAVDWAARNVYWTDAVLGRVEVATLAGRHRTVLVYDGLLNARAVAVAPHHGLLFWSDWGDRQPKIERAALDGSERIAIVADGLGWANGLALDLDRDRIYWCDAKNDRIEHANFDGSDRMVLINDNLPHTFGLSILGDYLYWTDWQRRTIARVNKETGGNREHILEKISNIMGLKAIRGTPYVADNRTHPCTAHDCDQICLNVRGRRACICQLDHELQADGRSCRIPSAYLLYTKRDGLARASLERANTTTTSGEGGETPLPIGGVRNASSLAVDAGDARVYWSDLRARAILRAFLNGSDAQKVVELGVQAPAALAVDWVALNVYWADAVLHRIEVARLDGSSRRVLVWRQGGVEQRHIALDPQEGYMYWTETAPLDVPSNVVRKAAMDGSAAKNLLVLSGVPSGFTIDHDRRRLFWAVSRPTPGIFSSDLNGLSRTTLVEGVAQQLYRPLGLAVHLEHIYWLDAITKGGGSKSSPSAQIWRANKLTGGDRTSMQQLWSQPTDMLVVVNDDASRKPVANQCAVNNGDCSHLCLALPDGNFTCACPTHYALRNGTCAPPQRFLLYSRRNVAVRLLPDTAECLEAVLPVAGMKLVRAVDFDPTQQMLYWIEGKARSIRRARATGTHASVVVLGAAAAVEPFDIAIDALGRLLFWSCSAQNVVNVTRIDSNATVGVVVSHAAGERPRLLAVHVLRRLLFYTDASEPTRIMRRRMDGTGRQVLVVGARGAAPILALVVDADNNLVIWAQGRNVHACAIDGSGRRLLLLPNDTSAARTTITQLAVLNGWLYYLDGEGLRRMEMLGGSGSNTSAVVAELDADVSDLVAIVEPPAHHACAAKRCSLLCVHDDGEEAVCACPTDLTLVAGGSAQCVARPDCGAGYFTCDAQPPHVKDCIPISWKCDGQRDCPDGSDEAGCPRCQPHEHRCASGDCIDARHYCDGAPHCADESDEAHCCQSPHEFQCRDTQVCIARAFLCDGVDHCANGEDETAGVCRVAAAAAAGGGAHNIGIGGSAAAPATSVALWIVAGIIGVGVAAVSIYILRRHAVACCTPTAASSHVIIDHAQDPLNPVPAQSQLKMQKLRNKSLGFPDLVHMSMLAGSQAGSYDRGHITGASSSTNGSSFVGYPRETLNPPPSPATTAASTRANSPTARYRPYKHYRSINQPPPPTPCSTDFNDESDYNYSSRSRYDDRRFDGGGPFPPPPTPRSHCNSESCPPSPSSRSSTYFSPLPPPPSPVASPGSHYDS